MAVGIEVPGFSIVEMLDDSGGQAVVYRAKQPSVAGRDAAIKLYDRILGSDRDRRRFEREVAAVARLSGHRHVVQLYDAGVLPDGRPYLVMELCVGGSLARRLRDEGHLSGAEVRDIGVKITRALGAAHDAGILHRDIKPDNLLVSPDGEPLLADFGIAAVQQPGRTISATLGLLTVQYAAPEVFDGADPSPATDIYSLGATLYTLLLGRPPRFPEGRQPSLAEILRLHAEPIPDIVGVPVDLTALLRQMMASDPADRPGPASEVAEAFARLSLAEPAVPWDTAPNDPEARDTGAGATGAGGSAPSASVAGAVPRDTVVGGPVPTGVVPRDSLADFLAPDAATLVPAQAPARPLDRGPTPPPPGPATAPSWLAQLDRGQEVAYSGPGGWIAVTAGGALAFVPLCLHAIANFHSNLGMLALLFGLAGLVLCARGRTGVGIGAFVLSALSGHYAAAGGITDPWFQPNFSHLGWRTLFIPALLALVFGAAMTHEETTARAAAQAAVGGGSRWFGADLAPGTGEPRIGELAVIPAACFFSFPAGACEHVVASGSRVAMIHAATWPSGLFSLADGGEVLRNGRGFDAGTRELRAVRAEYERRSKRLSSCRAYVVVHTGSVIGAEPAVRLEIPASDEVDVITADEFIEVVGGFLAGDPYRIEASVFKTLYDEAVRDTARRPP